MSRDNVVEQENNNSNEYYIDKTERIAELLRVKSVILRKDSIVVDGALYPIVNDVIIMLEPSQYSDSLSKMLGVDSVDNKTDIFAPDIQDHYSKFWKEWPGLHSRYDEEFDGYFDLVDLNSLKGAKVCDLGCGMGRWSYMLSKRVEVGEIVLVDFSDAIFTARKLFEKDSNVIYFMTDLLRLPFPKYAFDFAMSLGVLHHLPADCLEVTRHLKTVAPRFLLYLYYALDNKPFYYRLLLHLYTPVRKVTCKVKSEPIRVAFSWLAVLVTYLPFIGLGYILKPVGLSKYIPLFDEHHWGGIGGMRHSAYDRFFTRIEQRVSRKQIMKLEDTYDRVTVGLGQAYWHFLCESNVHDT